MILSLDDTEISQTQATPSIPSPHFISPQATIIGDVTIGSQVSIFPGVVARGDIERIYIGNKSNLQEHVVLHTSRGNNPCRIGKGVTVGHRAIVHSAMVSDFVIVGMGAIILDNAEIGTESIVGAGSLVTVGKRFPPRSLIFGSPAKVIRELTTEEINSIHTTADRYVEAGARLAGASVV